MGEPGDEERSWRPGPVDLACGALAAVLVVTGALLSWDTWWHLTLGEATLREGRIPAVETLSWTAAGAPLASHAWLFDLLIAALARLGGLGLVEVFGALLVALTLRMVHAAGRSLGASPTFALLAAILGAHLALHHLILRPQLVTYLAFAWLFRAWLEWRAGRSRAIRWAPLVVLAWSNLHGGFLLGVAFLGATAALEALEARLGDAQAAPRARGLVLLCVLSAVTACVHPSGPRQFVDALVNTPLFDPVHARINEWRPPDLAQVGALRGWVLAAVALALLAPRPTGERSSGAPAPRAEAAALLGGLLVALGAWRNVPLLALVGGPVLAAWATRALPRSPALLSRVDAVLGRGDRGPGGWALLVAAAVVAGAVEVARPRDVLAGPIVSRLHPVAAARWAREHGPRGRLFNSYMWGGYLGWALPEHPVAIDSRMLPFREFFLGDYATLWGARPGWREVVERHRIAWTLLEKDSVLANALRGDPGWRLVHEDGVAAVFVRAGGENEHLPAVPPPTR